LKYEHQLKGKNGNRPDVTTKVLDFIKSMKEPEQVSAKILP